MPVTIKIPSKAKNKTKLTELEHHRNPSGLHNKVKWILKEMKWDLNNLDEVWDKIVWVDKKSWEKAFYLAIYILKPKHLTHPSFSIAYVYERKFKWYRELVEKNCKRN